MHAQQEALLSPFAQKVRGLGNKLRLTSGRKLGRARRPQAADKNL